jgi:peptide/nickel transport system ATP-binding protein
MSAAELRALRWKFQIVSQHPDNALNPRWTIAQSILEPFRIHRDHLNGRGLNGELDRLIDLVGLEAGQAARYPHQLSGGELQRAVIARAIALDPAFIVCDEPTSMLDVSIQASIIRLLQERKRDIGCACLFITHDIGLARILGDRVAVMLGGRIVEEGEKILDHPVHPFTRRIVFPAGTSRGNDLPGDARGIPGACVFLPSCPLGTARCHTTPGIREYNGRRVSCHMVG